MAQGPLGRMSKQTGKAASLSSLTPKEKLRQVPRCSPASWLSGEFYTVNSRYFHQANITLLRLLIDWLDLISPLFFSLLLFHLRCYDIKALDLGLLISEEKKKKVKDQPEKYQ